MHSAVWAETGVKIAPLIKSSQDATGMPEMVPSMGAKVLPGALARSQGPPEGYLWLTGLVPEPRNMCLCLRWR